MAMALGMDKQICALMKTNTVPLTHGYADANETPQNWYARPCSRKPLLQPNIKISSLLQLPLTWLTAFASEHLFHA